MKRKNLDIEHKYESDFDYVEREYNVTYSILDKNNNILITKEGACFGTLHNSSVNLALRQGKWFVFHLYKPYTDLLTKTEKYKWLRFLKSIKYFKPFINIKQILETNEFKLDLEKVQSQQLFPLLVLVRVLQEQQKLLLQVIKYDPYEKRPVDNITLLKLLSGLYPVYNPGHWFSFIGSENYNQPFDELTWYKKSTLKVYKPTLSFSSLFRADWDIQDKITKEFFNKILNEQS